mmetsp:Transcript_16871/g.25522  ORF Transcript_16871/g.25522 Transcript_16871/m.25522 type:complete len:469 (-) Transcript_16871:139-1545(-)|eukprot:CAMPEP_0178932936 /NCGR_PEP_ID=MMETSP0786-20121207/22942_1 /TAXON_ID=186022 /ORGANISM="Thalassionema frauenfeldii, Strain CCMP 1798" /LENGTH=468 /DNA_ID=CAMNT_0020610379 /DNA_START=823 /DNA_END=2229 /DNA_ORIENTATION=+
MLKTLLFFACCLGQSASSDALTTHPTYAPFPLVAPTVPISLPTPPPLEPTDAPVTASPVEPTDAPVDPTDAPIDPTNAPVSPTDAPVTPPTVTPTIPLDKFSWDLERIGNATIVFDESTSDQEILLTYNASLRTTVVTVFDEDCNVAIGPDVIGISQETTITSPTHGLLEVFLDLKEDAIIDSLIWSDDSDTSSNDSGPSTGYVDFCVRVDLRLNDGSSVNFDEHKVHITVGLSIGFNLSEAIDLDREAAKEIFEEVDTTYEIQSCQCNASFICEEETLSQGDDLYVCVFTNVTNIEISAIEEVDLVQGSLSISAVSNSTVDALTTASLYGKLAVIRTQLRSALFAELDPEDLSVSGKCSITFSNDTATSSSRRKLRFESFRNLQSVSQDEDDVNFNLEVGLSRALISEKDNKYINEVGSDVNSILGFTMGALATIVLGIVVAVVFKKKRNRHEEKDQEELPEGMSVI